MSIQKVQPKKYKSNMFHDDFDEIIPEDNYTEEEKQKSIDLEDRALLTKKAQENALGKKLKALDSKIERTDKLLCKAKMIASKNISKTASNKASNNISKNVSSNVSTVKITSENSDIIGLEMILEDLLPSQKEFLKQILSALEDTNSGLSESFFINKNMPEILGTTNNTIRTYLSQLSDMITVENVKPQSLKPSRKFRRISINTERKNKILALLD